MPPVFIEDQLYDLAIGPAAPYGTPRQRPHLEEWYQPEYEAIDILYSIVPQLLANINDFEIAEAISLAQERQEKNRLKLARKLLEQHQDSAAHNFSVSAGFAGMCLACGDTILLGHRIVPYNSGWAHLDRRQCGRSDQAPAS